jgi:hypothetical protein
MLIKIELLFDINFTSDVSIFYYRNIILENKNRRIKNNEKIGFSVNCFSHFNFGFYLKNLLA